MKLPLRSHVALAACLAASGMFMAATTPQTRSDAATPPADRLIVTGTAVPARLSPLAPGKQAHSHVRMQTANGESGSVYLAASARGSDDLSSHLWISAGMQDTPPCPPSAESRADCRPWRRLPEVSGHGHVSVAQLDEHETANVRIDWRVDNAMPSSAQGDSLEIDLSWTLVPDA